ncbi:hypothetical protein BGZ51_000696, partial [Haplosporangium sp. Z 767]
YPPDPPRDHWPNIISIMQGSASILHQFRSQYFYDRKIGCTYYVARVDSHVSIVIIYLDRHPQPDAGAMDFLQLLAGKLRHTDVLSAMRQDYRLMSLSTVGIDIPKILPKTEKAQQMYDSGTLELRNTVLGEGIECEIQVLRHGLLMDKAVAEYDIQKSATHLHLAKVSLSEWQRISSEQEYLDKSHHKHEETSWRYNLFSGSEDKAKASVKGKLNLLPSHLLWLHRWIASEKSKMTIYFMNVLLEKERILGGDERSLWANMDPDMHG